MSFLNLFGPNGLNAFPPKADLSKFIERSLYNHGILSPDEISAIKQGSFIPSESDVRQSQDFGSLNHKLHSVKNLISAVHGDDEADYFEDRVKFGETIGNIIQWKRSAYQPYPSLNLPPVIPLPPLSFPPLTPLPISPSPIQPRPNQLPFQLPSGYAYNLQSYLPSKSQDIKEVEENIRRSRERRDRSFEKGLNTMLRAHEGIGFKHFILFNGKGRTNNRSAADSLLALHEEDKDFMIFYLSKNYSQAIINEITAEFKTKIRDCNIQVEGVNVQKTGYIYGRRGFMDSFGDCIVSGNEDVGGNVVVYSFDVNDVKTFLAITGGQYGPVRNEVVPNLVKSLKGTK